MSTCQFGTPIWSDASVLYTPTFSSPTSWSSNLPLTNLADRRLARVARTSSAALIDTIFTADLKVDRAVRLVAIPKHTMSSAGRYRVVGYPASVLFDYEPGDNIVGKGGTFARTGAATYFDVNGTMQTAATGVARDAHYIGGNRHLLLEKASTNLLLRSQEFDNAAWAATAVTVTADQTTAPDGTVTADLLNKTSTVATGSLIQTITVANDTSTYTGSVWLKAGTARYCAVAMLFFNGVTVSVGVVVDLTLGTITNTAIGTSSPIRSSITAYANGWYRVSITVANTAGGNTGAQFRIFPAWNNTGGSGNDVTTTGTCYTWGAQEEIQPVATSYIATTSATVTRNADTLSFTYTPTPQALTVYTKGVSGQPSSFDGSFLWEIGTAAGTRISCHKTNGAATLTGTHRSAAGTVTSVPAAVVLIGDTLETRTALASTGAITQADSVNSAAETIGTTSAVNALDGAWAATTLYLNADASAANIGAHAFRTVRITTAAPTLTTLQGLVYDSGWLTPWPGSLTAEDLAKPDGTSLNVMAFTQVPSTFNDARYWTFQFDDTTNSAGDLDIARLAICGSFTPSINITDGEKFAYEDDTIRSVTPGGAALYDVRGERRTDQFSINNLTQGEALGTLRKMQRQLGVSGQFIWIPDPSDTTYGYERNFLAVMRELDSLEWVTTRYNSTFGIVEEL